MIYHSLPWLLISGWLLAVLPWLIPNIGGRGLNLPQNAIAWIMMSAVVCVIWSTGKRACHTAPEAASITSRRLLAGSIILGLPILYASPALRDLAYWRLAGLAGGLIFYCSLLRFRFTPGQQRALIYAVLCAAALQALFVVMLYFIPAWVPYPVNGGRATGVFQQANLLASFIATGFALTWMVFILPDFHLRQPRAEKRRRTLLGVLLILFSSVIAWQQSRIGWLGAGLAVVCAALLCWHAYPRQVFRALLLSLAGCGAGVLAIVLSPFSAIGHEGSNHARIAMLRLSLKMIEQKPWLGWGYGSFESAFSRFRIAEPFLDDVTRHPHNEILYWLVEGGMVAGLGLCLIIAAGLALLLRAWRQHHRGLPLASGSPSGAILLCVAMLPVALHTQTEYPFYASTPHLAVFLLLMALVEKSTLAPGRRPRPLTSTLNRIASLTLPLLALLLGLLMAGSLYGNAQLTRAEQNGLRNIGPLRQLPRWASWPFTGRLQFDLQTHALLTFNRTRDERLLDNYLQWARGYLARRIDRNTLASVLAILRYRQQNEEADRLLWQARRLFPGDASFLPGERATHPGAENQE